MLLCQTGVAASTKHSLSIHKLVLAAFRRLPLLRVLLVLAPRHSVMDQLVCHTSSVVVRHRQVVVMGSGTLLSLKNVMTETLSTAMDGMFSQLPLNAMTDSLALLLASVNQEDQMARVNVYHPQVFQVLLSSTAIRLSLFHLSPQLLYRFLLLLVLR
jgi:hypothetical protein